MVGAVSRGDFVDQRGNLKPFSAEEAGRCLRLYSLSFRAHFLLHPCALKQKQNLMHLRRSEQWTMAQAQRQGMR